jgi:hypothetical protein
MMQDILLVKPIPRLLLAFESMDAEALMDAAVRLAKQDWRLTRHRPQPIKTLQSLVVDDISLVHDVCAGPHIVHRTPIPLPGGQSFVLVNASRTQLRVHDANAGSLLQYRLLVPEQTRPIKLWKVVTQSSDELLVAIVTVAHLKDKQWYVCTSEPMHHYHS